MPAFGRAFAVVTCPTVAPRRLTDLAGNTSGARSYYYDDRIHAVPLAAVVNFLSSGPEAHLSAATRAALQDESLAVREAHPGYQLDRVRLFARLLADYPASLEEIRAEAAIGACGWVANSAEGG